MELIEQNDVQNLYIFELSFAKDTIFYPNFLSFNALSLMDIQIYWYVRTN